MYDAVDRLLEQKADPLRKDDTHKPGCGSRKTLLECV